MGIEERKILFAVAKDASKPSVSWLNFEPILLRERFMALLVSRMGKRKILFVRATADSIMALFIRIFHMRFS